MNECAKAIKPTEQSEIETLMVRITRLAEKGYDMATTVGDKRSQYFGEEPKVEVSDDDIVGVIAQMHKRLGDLELFIDIATYHIERM